MTGAGTCTASGLLLKPDRASPPDGFWMATLADADAAACRGDLSVTHTALKLVNDDAHGSSEGGSDGAGGVYLWLYAVGVQLCSPYSLSYSDWVEAAEPFLPSPNRPSRTLQDDDKEEEEDADASTVRGQHTASDDSSFYRNATISTIVYLVRRSRRSGLEGYRSRSRFVLTTLYPRSRR